MTNSYRKHAEVSFGAKKVQVVYRYVRHIISPAQNALFHGRGYKWCITVHHLYFLRAVRKHTRLAFQPYKIYVCLPKLLIVCVVLK